MHKHGQGRDTDRYIDRDMDTDTEIDTDGEIDTDRDTKKDMDRGFLNESIVQGEYSEISFCY